jgi:hypothetical protein
MLASRRVDRPAPIDVAGLNPGSITARACTGSG